MKKNSWKTLLSVLLLLAMLVSMLPFAAFAEGDQTAAAQTEEPAKTEDVPKVEEKTGDTPKADGKTDATKTDEKSGDTVKDDTTKDTVKDESKDTPNGDATKAESKDAPKNDAAKDESKDVPNGDTENPPMGDTEDPDKQIATLDADGNTPPVEFDPNKTAVLTYSPNGGSGDVQSFYESGDPGTTATFTVQTVDQLGFTAPDGKTFDHWSTLSDGGVPYSANDPIDVSVGKSATLYAQWADGLDWSKLKIEKKVDKDTALPGETLNYTITVTNNTGCDLSYICVEDTFPSCIQGFYGTGSNVKWKYTTRSDSIEAKLQDGLKADDVAFFSVEATLTSNASGTAVNKAEITEATAANSTYGTMPEGAGNSATATTSIERAPGSDLPGLTISVTPNTSIADINQEFTYTVEITNNTGKHLKIVRVSNGLPTGVERLGNRAVEGSWHLNTNSSTGILSANLIGEKGLPDGTSASYNVNAKFSYYKTATTATNKADIYEVRIGNDITSGNFGTAYAEVYSLKNLTIEKTVDKSTAKPGDTLTYTVEVTNNTDTDLDEVYVEDFLPGTLAYTGSTLVDGATGTLSHDSQLGTVTAKVTGLKKGAAAKYTVTAKVNADASGEINSLAKITKAVRGTDTVDITTTKEASAKTTVYTPVPVNVKVLFNGLKDVSQVPAGYTLTGADSNIFPKGDLKGNITLAPAVKDASGQISRTFTTTADVLLGQEYSLSFTQSDYDIPGYICTLTTETDPIKVTAQDAIAGINAEITLSYVKENLYTYPSLTVRTYFKGLAKLPDSFGYKLNCVSAPEDAIAFQGPLALTPGTENGVPYLEFSAKNVTLQAGTELTFSFTQSGYDVPGYLCALGNSTFKFTLPVPTTDVRQPILLKIENTYTQPDWSKLTITKTADKTSATPGSVVNYTVTVTNNTGVDLSDIIVADKLDSRLRYSSSTGDYDTGTGTWTVASLANGKSVTLTLTVKLKYALAAGTVIENTASVTEAAAAGLIYDLSGQKLNDSVSVTVTSGKGSPRTGDDSNLGLWIAVMAASLACAGAAAVIYKKRRG